MIERLVKLVLVLFGIMKRLGSPPVLKRARLRPVDATISSLSEKMGPPRLPPELLREIFSHEEMVNTADRIHDLISFSLVCRAWTAVAQSLLFETVEPRTYRAALGLLKVIRRNPMLASFIRRLVPPIFKAAYMPDDRRKEWRSQPVFNLSASVIFLLSERDHKIGMRIFDEIARSCPRLMSGYVSHFYEYRGKAMVSLKAHKEMERVAATNIKSLLLLRVVFSTGLDKQNLPMELTQHDSIPSHTRRVEFPHLEELQAYDFPTHFLSYLTRSFSFPKLKCLRMAWGSCRQDELFNFLQSIKPTLQSLYFDGRVESPIANELPSPWYDRLANMEGNVLSSIQELTMRPSRRKTMALGDGYDLRTISSLKRLNLMAYGSVLQFTEIKSYLPAVEELYITCTLPYRSRTTLLLFRQLNSLLKEKEVRMPMLKVVIVDWRIERTREELMWWKVAVFCVNEVCERQGVRLLANVKMMDTPDHHPENYDLDAWRTSKLLSVIDRTLSDKLRI